MRDTCGGREIDEEGEKRRECTYSIFFVVFKASLGNFRLSELSHSS